MPGSIPPAFRYASLSSSIIVAVMAGLTLAWTALWKIVHSFWSGKYQAWAVKGAGGRSCLPKC